MRTVAGTHYFTFPYPIEDGRIGAEFDARVRYVIDLGRPAALYPPPGEPEEPDEVVELTELEIEAYRVLSEEERLRNPRRYFHRYWVAPDAHLEALIRAYLQGGGRDDLIGTARLYGRTRAVS